ncbi:MAG: hypothetical protein B7O98_08875 [Zestosphaera tikiterensis]|uniref:Uncharacterized protein n=1 Tax=Zestosphaera tikiterensis TaxID=1973259 RepID=A0A2R7Y2I3_9CREN|nr:MAG: hypothetical protein B7O98_08705 [Zestosphaera tikiterensis]PUA31726.1 MAG: hypothetical protein B7O98_08875 [Zestosphaera tikiterensis]
MSVRDSQFHNKAIVDEIIGFIAEHYSSFMVEDALFQELRESIKNLSIELYMKYLYECEQVSYTSSCRGGIEKYLNELLRTFYATSNEPVRLGAFRALLHEVYRRVHGSCNHTIIGLQWVTL